MSHYFILWKRNNELTPPTDPKLQIQQTEGFLQLMRHQLSDGSLKEVHSFLKGDQGYAISKDVTEERLYSDLQGWLPWVTFEVHQTIPFPKGIELSLEVQKNIAKQMQAMMTTMH